MHYKDINTRCIAPRKSTADYAPFHGSRITASKCQ